MEFNICHLYPDLLNVYGDFGNIAVLRYRLEQRGFKVNIHNVSIGDNFESSLYDIVFFGGGQDYEQAIVSSDLMENKKESIKEYIENDGVFLSICGGYQLLGKYYTTPDGQKLEGLNILDLYTEPGDTRFIGNTVIYNEDFDHTYVGFENHSGRTYLGNLKSFGKCIEGYGNNGTDGHEGCIYKNTFGTYFHGPLLSKNPELADKLIYLAVSKRTGSCTLEPLDDRLELKAKEIILNKFKSQKN